MYALALAVSLPLLFVPAPSASGSGVRGDWRTPDGNVVRIATCGNDVCATLVQVEADAPTRLDGNNPNPALRSRSLCGLRIGYGFHLTDPNHAEDGHLYDPKSGKTYKGVLTTDGDMLDLRGYIGIKAFGRSEHWTRTSDNTPVCK